ncbi:putative ABC-type transport system involved in lysophospholipase L1 biosynthesis ATPase subunit [Evansella vedderi]|uniref:ABC-type transport system involved in lysophospholipase L1 biosynthesis ATPase subunit n=2 Tax=Evansella vedderi TaxID=38282 RepID=A0ABT9ZTG2_9BACI|nr:putative ABC-type transport system involved in lysophospholipase L1 biosynthesis ATPase subunit [Evansella vedderi]
MLPLLKFFSKSDICKRAEETIIRIGLKNRIDYLPSRLSSGDQQRAAIARALVTEPKIILADEPTGNLDSENSTKIIELLESIYYFDGTTLVIVTHDNDIAMRAKDIILLKDGKIK